MRLLVCHSYNVPARVEILMMFVRSMLCYACALLICVGCSSETEIPTYPVTGTITQKGKPIEGAIVALHRRPEGRLRRA